MLPLQNSFSNWEGDNIDYVQDWERQGWEDVVWALCWLLSLLLDKNEKLPSHSIPKWVTPDKKGERCSVFSCYSSPPHPTPQGHAEGKENKLMAGGHPFHTKWRKVCMKRESLPRSGEFTRPYHTRANQVIPESDILKVEVGGHRNQSLSWRKVPYNVLPTYLSGEGPPKKASLYQAPTFPSPHPTAVNDVLSKEVLFFFFWPKSVAE